MNETTYNSSMPTTAETNLFENVNPQTISFSSNLGNLDPEIAKMALANAPELAQTSREAITSTKEVTNRGFASNDLSMQYYCENAERSAEAVRKCMEDEKISENAKVELAGVLKDINLAMAAKDTENKGFIDKEILKYMACSIGVTALTAGLMGAGFAIGLKLPPIRFK